MGMTDEIILIIKSQVRALGARKKYLPNLGVKLVDVRGLQRQGCGCKASSSSDSYRYSRYRQKISEPRAGSNSRSFALHASGDVQGDEYLSRGWDIDHCI